MKLYYSPGACSLSPHIVMHEAGLPVELVKVDLKAKTADGGDYLAINPKGYVPVLQLEDGSILTEGPAIVQYLADRVPAAKLAPAAGTMARYRLVEWLNFLASEIHKGFSPLFNPKLPGAPALSMRDGTSQSPSRLRARHVDLLRRPRSPCGPANTAGPQWLDASRGSATADYAPSLRSPWRAASEDAKTIMRERLASRFDYLSAQLRDKPCLMGGDFTAADAYLFTLLGWCGLTGIDLAKWPVLVAYRERIAARPAVREAMKAEGLIKA